jgi:hypothetical protein
MIRENHFQGFLNVMVELQKIKKIRRCDQNRKKYAFFLVNACHNESAFVNHLPVTLRMKLLGSASFETEWFGFRVVPSAIWAGTEICAFCLLKMIAPLRNPLN